MARRFGISVVAGLCLAVVTAAACRSEAEPTEAPKKGPTYALEVQVPAMKNGGTGKAQVVVKAAKGYHWNKEYPAKLVFAGEPKRVALAKAEFKQADFKASEEKAEVEVSLQAREAGAETVQGEIRFSVCNDVSCIIEKADVALAVNVAP